MKTRSLKLAACLLAGAITLSAGAVPAFADNENYELTSQVSGISLLLNDIEEKPESELIADVMKEKETQDAERRESVDYANIGVARVSDYVNIRSEASTDSDIIGRMENNAVAVIEGEENGWYKITSGSISGYIFSDFLTVGDRDLIESVKTKTAVVQTTSLRVRSEASTEAAVMLLVSADDQLEVLDESTEGWVKVNTSEGEGYVSADYVMVEDTYLYAKKPEQVSGGSAVAGYGLQFVGNPYKWGGTSLTNGADCSGFIMSVYAHYGVSLPHSSSALRGVGTEVSYSEAQPGDIICYNGHVALYIGNGQIVHAANERKGITVSSATYNNIITVRRIFN